MEVDSYTTLCNTVTLQSNKNGFFQNVVNDIINEIDENWLDNFRKLPTNKERINKCFTDEMIKNSVRQMMENVQEIYRGKSASMSRLRRQEADHLYKKGKKEKSILMYTQAVVRAPVAGVDKNYDDGLSLAAALWKRSTVLYEMKRIGQCLDDVKLCIKEKLPESLRLDAYWRMAECYIHLKQFNEARISLNILLQMTNRCDCCQNAPAEWKKKIETKLNELVTYISRSNDLKIPKSVCSKSCCQVSFELADGESSKLQNASSKLKVTQNDKAGKYFVANKPIKTGDILIIEKPYVSCLSVEKYGSHCHHCLQKLETAVPCTDCSGVAFCSVECKKTALNTYHKYECHYLDLLIGSGMSILCFAALRIVSQENVKYFTEGCLENKSFSHHPYRQVFNMEKHSDKRTADDFLRRTLMSLFLLAVLKKSGYFSTSNDGSKIYHLSTEEFEIANVLLRNLEILQFNAHEIYEIIKCKDTTKPLRTLNIGIGLYKTASYFNHDCFPAVSRYFIGTKLIVKAIRAISEDQIVGDSYGSVFTKCHKVERQNKLRGRYWFDCECQACVENWPLLENVNTNHFRIKCSKCGITIKTSVETQKLRCPQCNNSINCKTISKQIENLKKITIIPLQDMNEDTVQTMCTSFDTLNKTLRPPHLIYHNVERTLLQYWMNRVTVASF